MNPTAQQVMVLASAAFGSLLSMVALWGAWGAWLRQRHPADLALCVAAATWMAHLVTTTVAAFTGSTALSEYAGDAQLQVLIVSISLFLLTRGGLGGTSLYLGLGLQTALGGLALHWSYWGATGQVEAHSVWILVNLLAALVWLACIAHRLHVAPDFHSWLALAGGIFGLGIAFDTVLLPSDAGRVESLLRHFYAAFLIVMWHLVSTQPADAGHLEPGSLPFADSRDPHGQTGFEQSQSQIEITASAVAGERRRIAQDLHDGVASQLVNILSSLDSRAPQQQAVALALENCLLDLKMTVDAIDCGNDSVVEALGRLRYRVQHSLDKLGITMAWKVAPGTELEAVRGDVAQQVLRIAQECLANVMRHAHASAVEVVCRFEPEQGEMLLEIRDNGAGIALTGQATGKGLDGMRRRARQAGGDLRISSKVGAGTRVRLTLPLNADQLMAA